MTTWRHHLFNWYSHTPTSTISTAQCNDNKNRHALTSHTTTPPTSIRTNSIISSQQHHDTSLVKGFPPKNPQTKKTTTAPKKSLAEVASKKPALKSPTTTIFRDFGFSVGVHQYFDDFHRMICQFLNVAISHNKGHMATLADLTPCAKLSKNCCLKTEKECSDAWGQGWGWGQGQWCVYPPTRLWRWKWQGHI